MKRNIKKKFIYAIIFMMTVILAYGWRLGTGRVINSDEEIGRASCRERVLFLQEKICLAGIHF